ncbi:MAG: hypothetical protein EB015_12435 [Methylocystaceae bacterium]|nr:hypothetical protein [Methylocystaceae bacterium]
MAFDFDKWISIFDCEFPDSQKTHVTDVTGVILEIFGVTEAVTPSKRRNTPCNHWCACGDIGIFGAGFDYRNPTRTKWFCSKCAKSFEQNQSSIGAAEF